MINTVHILSREEIEKKLLGMEVITGIDFPMKYLSFLTKNLNYDPDSFSQEIENMEKDDISDTTNVILYLTGEKRRTNSKMWLDNHSKICQVKFHPMAMIIQSCMHENGRRDYCTEENIKKIAQFAEVNGGIVDF